MPFNLLSFELAESERKKAEKTQRKVGAKLIMRIFVGSTRALERPKGKKRENKEKGESGRERKTGERTTQRNKKKVHFDLHFFALSNTPFMTFTAHYVGNPGCPGQPSINYNNNLLLISCSSSSSSVGRPSVLNDPLSRIISTC